MEKRIISVDWLRGFAIFYMIFLHIIVHNIFSYERSFISYFLRNVPIWLLIALVPLFILGIMGPIFTFVTAISVGYKMSNLMKTAPEQFPRYLKERIIYGLLIIAIYRVLAAVLGANYIMHGFIFFPTIGLRFDMDALDSIAWTGVLIPLILYLVWKISSPNRPRIVYYLFTGLAILIFAVAPFVNPLIKTAIILCQEKGLHICVYLLSKIGNGRFQFFPVFGYAFIGANMGIALQNQLSYRKILYYGLGIIVICLTTFGIAVLLGFDPVPGFELEEIPVPLQCVTMAGLQILTLTQLKRLDFAPPTKVNRRILLSTFMRRFGLLSLTFYMTEVHINRLIFRIFTAIIGPNVIYINEEPTLAWPAWLMIVAVIVAVLISYGLTLIWEKLHFKYSVEWLVDHIMAYFMHRNLRNTDPHQVLYYGIEHSRRFPLKEIKKQSPLLESVKQE